MRSWCSSGLRRACAPDAAELLGITQLRRPGPGRGPWDCALEPGAEVVEWCRLVMEDEGAGAAAAAAAAFVSAVSTRPSGSSWFACAADTLLLRGLSGVLLPTPLAEPLEGRAEETPVAETATAIGAAAEAAAGWTLSRLALRAGVAC